VGISRQKGNLLSKRGKTGEEISWEWTDMEIGKNSFLL
jgi:hypothetical protein